MFVAAFSGLAIGHLQAGPIDMVFVAKPQFAGTPAAQT